MQRSVTLLFKVKIIQYLYFQLAIGKFCENDPCG
jgi:hypothetical protein